jgi:hypothetical protein
MRSPAGAGERENISFPPFLKEGEFDDSDNPTRMSPFKKGEAM